MSQDKLLLDAAPYWDDFQGSKNFTRVLFKPGFGVQTRELNQMQTILQDQISKHADHIFQEGSLVTGGQFDLNMEADYVKIADLDTEGNSFTLSFLKGKRLRGTNSGVYAYVIHVEDGLQADAQGNTKTLYVKYAQESVTEAKFIANEQLEVMGHNFSIQVLPTGTPIGLGTLFQINEGVIYSRDTFVEFQPAIIVVDRYATLPSKQIGFRVNRDIITVNEDASLFDNALGTINYLAPGADRIQIKAELAAIDLDDEASLPEFVALLIVDEGNVKLEKQRTQYDVLREEFAKRTFDQSGDYIVNGFGVRVRDHLDTGTNNGLYELADGGDVDLLSLDVEPGVAYVKGFEVNHLFTEHVITDKASEFFDVNNQIAVARQGSFVKVNNVSGSLLLDRGVEVELRNVATTIIGTARAQNMAYVSGVKSTDAVYNLYLFDVHFTQGSFKDVTAVTRTNVGHTDFSADLVESVLHDADTNVLLLDTGAFAVRSFINGEGATDTSFVFWRSQILSLPTSGILTANVVTTSERFPYGTGTLSTAEKNNLRLTLNAGATVGGTPRAAGYELDLTAATVTSTDDTLTINLGVAVSAITSVTLTHKVQRFGSQAYDKVLRPSRFVKISCATSGTTGPFSLGFSDVYQVRQVRHHTAEPTLITDGTDITASTVVDLGQRDAFYDHATIDPKVALGASDWLLVELDYFHTDMSTGAGFFTVDSYPIDDAAESNTTIKTAEIPLYISPETGMRYDLRNYLDFRPVKAATSADAITIAAATTSPAASGDFAMRTNGMRTPVPNDAVTFDYTQYMSRIDVVYVNKEGVFGVQRGNAATFPLTPTISENDMAVARIYLAPYPSLSSAAAAAIGRPDLATSVERMTYKRFTMREIGVLQNRIDNVEYYASLNALEKKAVNLQVPDDNGLDRFKNGIFVDNFSSLSIADSNSPDLKIAIDPEKQEARPLFEFDSFGLDYETGSNVAKTGSLITLPFTETPMIEQLVATGTRNIEQGVYQFNGNLNIFPNTDVWVDTTQVDKNIDIRSGEEQFFGDKILNTQWNSWQSSITGKSTSKQWVRPFIAGVQRGLINHYEHSTISSVRTGTETYQTMAPEEQELGNFVTDTALIPYIRPQVLFVHGQGLKSNTQVYCFFDGEPMSAYCSPIDDQGEQGVEGNPLVTDADGEVRFWLRLPAEGKRFRVGSRKVYIADSPTNLLDITTYAEEEFYAAGLAQQKQNTILTTNVIKTQQREVKQKKVTSSTKLKYQQVTCSAYTFKVDVPEGAQGVFLTSVDVWIADKHAEYGVWFEIREVDPGGVITRTQVPYSEVWIDSDDITLSLNGIDNATKVTFPSPVFLYNDTQYAFIIHTVAINPDTYFWIARLGETDVATSLQHNARKLTGTFYTTNNNLDWVMTPDIDLKVRFNRAQFNHVVTGVADLTNEAYEFATVTTAAPLTMYGEEFIGLEQLRLTNITGGTPAEGNTATGVTSLAEGIITNVSGDWYATDGEGFSLNETVNITGGITAVVAEIKRTSVRLQSYDIVDNTAVFAESNGRIYEGEVLTGQMSAASVTIDTIDTYPWSTVDFEPNYLTFNGTALSFLAQSLPAAGGAMSALQSINVRDNTTFNTERVLKSYSNTPVSFRARATLTSDNEYVSPVVDTNRTHSVLVFNHINEDVTGEDGAVGGNLVNKYISSTVTLAEGQDAEDLVVILSAYRPPNSDVKVWVKIRHREDGDRMGLRPWVELTTTSEKYSSLSNPDDMIEVRYQFPEELMTGALAGEVEYDQVSDPTVTFAGFKQFAIKVGLLGTNSAVVPRIAELRAIALQK